MTPEQVRLVQESFAKIEPIADHAVDLFYERLFEIAPEIRPLFPPRIAGLQQDLLKNLSAVVTNLHQFEVILPAVEELGRRHTDYHVKPEDYLFVGVALLSAVKESLGNEATQEVMDAWSLAYGLIADAMKS